MKVGAGGTACGADLADLLSCLDIFVELGENLREVTVEGAEAAFMFDQDPHATGAEPSVAEDFAIGGGMNGRTEASADIETLVETLFSAEGVDA